MSQERIAEPRVSRMHTHEPSRDKIKNLLDSGQWSEALDGADSILGLNPGDYELQLLSGDALFHLGRLEEAVQRYKQVLELKPDKIMAYHKVAVALGRLEKITEADQYYARLFQQAPDFVKQNSYDFSVQQQSGDFFFRQKDWNNAVLAYQQAIKIEAKACWEHINLGRSLAKLERPIDAIAMLQKAIDIDENSGWANYHLAQVLYEQDRLEEALKYCRQSLLLMQSHLDSKTLMAKINSRRSRLEHSNNDKTPEGQSSTSSAPFSKNTNISSTTHQSSQANVISGWNESYELGKQLQIRGDLEESTKAYYQAIIKNPHHSWSYHELGDVNLKLNNWHEAIAAYQQAIRLNPSYFWSNYNLGIAYRNIGDWQSTVDLYIQSKELNPGLNLPVRALEETLIAWYNALIAEGDQFLRTNQAKAISFYEKAISVYRNNIGLTEFDVPREQKEHQSVLLIVDDHLSQCLRYRVRQKIEQLEHAGFTTAYYSWTNLEEVKNKISFFDIVIFYRTPAFPNIIKLIKYAKTIKKIVFYEIDDLIFDPDLFPEPIESYGGQVTEEQYDGLVRGTILFKEAMKLCDIGIASTPPLLAQMEKYLGKGNCYLHRNALDSNISAALEIDSPKVKRDYLSIFYGSGTKAHNSDFNELVAPALAKVLQKYSNVRLTLMGYLTIPEILEPYDEQIDRIDLVRDIGVYYEFLKQADISLAMLHPTVVNNCKSELKWFEAASFKIPSIVSNTEVYLEVIEDGSDGLIASTPQEWFDCLECLINDSELRQRIGQKAYETVMQKYSIAAMGDNIRSILNTAIARGTNNGDIVPRSSRKKLLIVNVFYSPQSIGGATRIVKDNVDILAGEYSEDYDISVFTTDEDCPEAYQILEYSWEGIPVTKVSSPMMEGMDWQYRNPKMYEIFRNYLEFHQPDLIHFHCVQRLTASVLEAAADLEIPYFVTAHDAWWISDHQFLVNENGEECNYQQNDPVIAARDARELTDSMQRKLYLRQQLNKATEVLSVSEAFSEIYRRNGFPQTKANRNGIQPKPMLPKQASASGRVRLAHIGGMAAHKGYFLFKEAVEQAKLSNTEVIVINHAQSPGTVEHADWNGTPVTFLAKFKQEEISKLYSMVDVLLAPSMWPESFGLVTREAVAAGVWVIASDKGAIAEDIIQDLNGDIVSVDNTSSLVHALKRIDRDPLKYQQHYKEIPAPVRSTSEQVRELTTLYAKTLMSL